MDMRTAIGDPHMSTLAARQSSVSWFLGKDLVKHALVDSFRRMTPRYQARNPVMFVVYVGSILTTILWVQALTGKGEAPAGFILAVTLWLWVTLLFANFAEAIAEGRSKAQAASLKSARKDTIAKKLAKPERGAAVTSVPSSGLRKGDIVYVEQGDLVPGDGEVIEGVASINESAITGESAPVIRAAGSDFNTVTGGTLVLSDWIVVRINVNPGEAFLDRMIGMVEGAKRQKTPNEIALLDQHDVALAEVGGRCRGPRGAALRLRELLRDRVLARGLERGCLRLAAPFGDRLGEVREQQRDPEPQRDRQDEPRRRLALAGERLEPEDRRQDAADVDDEHHRIAPLVTRREPPEAVDEGRLHGVTTDEPRQRSLFGDESCHVDSSGNGAVSCRRRAGNARRPDRAPAPERTSMHRR